jgi:hypothetical protein
VNRPRGHCVVPFAGRVVGIEWNGERARRVAALVCGAAAEDDRLPDVIFRLGSHPESDLLTLFDGRACLYRGTAIGTAAQILLEAALRSLIGQSADGLVIHAAVLGRGTDGVLLPGPTGSGKTMLSAWLATRGLAHLSDEACFVADAESPVDSFARPFSFKGPWAEVLGVADIDQSRVLRDDAVSLVPRELLATAPRCAAIRPRLIVFPRFRPQADFELTRLTPARAAVRLIGSVANAANLSDHGIGRAATLARAVAAYSLTYGHFAQLSPLLRLIESLS